MGQEHSATVDGPQTPRCIDRELNIGDGGSLQVGAKLRDDIKKFDAKLGVWDRAASAANRFTLADFNLLGPQERVEFKDRTYTIDYTIGQAVIPFTDAIISCVEGLAGPDNFLAPLLRSAICWTK